MKQVKQDSGRDPAILATYRSWISERVQKLKREIALSKKDCWRIASKEWLEMRRLQKRKSEGKTT